MTVRRLNWGCGTHVVDGWINADRKVGGGIDLSCDIRDGLPLESDSIDYAVSIHALPEVPYPELVPTLRELRRVLRPGAPLRLVLPDLNKAIAAYQRGDRDYFLIPDEEVTGLSSKMIVQLIWYGYSRTLFTPDFIQELLLKAGFRSAVHCGFGQTASPFGAIVELDNRPDESLFVEAVK
jgi:hypothetical protein